MPWRKCAVAGTRGACHGAWRENDETNKSRRHLFIWMYHASGMLCLIDSMYLADTTQLFSGRPPYSWLPHSMTISGAILEGKVPFRDSEIANVNDKHKKYSLGCLSRDFRSRPDVSGIVKFLRTERTMYLEWHLYGLHSLPLPYLRTPLQGLYLTSFLHVHIIH